MHKSVITIPDVKTNFTIENVAIGQTQIIGAQPIPYYIMFVPNSTRGEKLKFKLATKDMDGRKLPSPTVTLLHMLTSICESRQNENVSNSQGK